MTKKRKPKIVGVGLDNYRFYDPKRLVSHSEYGEIATNTGLPGFLIYFGIWWLMWRRSGRMLKHASDPIDNRIGGVFRGLLATLLIFGFGAPMYMVKWAWSLLGTFIGYAMTVEENDLYRQQVQLAWYQHQWHATQAHWRTVRQQQLAEQERSGATESS